MRIIGKIKRIAGKKIDKFKFKSIMYSSLMIIHKGVSYGRV